MVTYAKFITISECGVCFNRILSFRCHCSVVFLFKDSHSSLDI